MHCTGHPVLRKSTEVNWGQMRSMTFADFFRVLLPSKVIWGADFDSDIHFALRRFEMRSWNHRVIKGQWRHMTRKWFFEFLTPNNYPWAFTSCPWSRCQPRLRPTACIATFPDGDRVETGDHHRQKHSVTWHSKLLPKRSPAIGRLQWSGYYSSCDFSDNNHATRVSAGHHQVAREGASAGLQLDVCSVWKTFALEKLLITRLAILSDIVPYANYSTRQDCRKKIVNSSALDITKIANNAATCSAK